MTTRASQNFDLQFTHTATGYRVCELGAPTDQASADFGLPPAALDPQALATRLFDLVLAGAVGDALRRRLDAAQAIGAVVHIRLDLDETPELRVLPWASLAPTAVVRHPALAAITPLVCDPDLPYAEPTAPSTDNLAPGVQATPQIHSGGGAVVQGNVAVNGNFIGRDQIMIVVQRPEEAVQLREHQQHLAALQAGDFALLPFEPVTVLVAGGDCWMGSVPGDGIPANETPYHPVQLPDYRISQTPITNRQYAAFLQRTGHVPPRKPRWFLQEPPPGKEEHPVTGVSWHDAVAYCAWLSQVTTRCYRLPTEAEWEKAARWNQAHQYAQRYPWGDEWRDGCCNLNRTETTPVNAYLAGASPYGCLDMVGNVEEWTSTLWGSRREVSDYPYPYRADDGREDPKAATHLARLYRVHRGGCYRDAPSEVRASARGMAGPETAVSWRGFRVVLAIVHLHKG